MGFSNYQLQQNCLLEMSKNGIPFDGPVVVAGEVQRFSIDSKKNKKDEWYIAWSGISQRGNEYLICIYGSWSSSNTLEGKHTFKSWDSDHFLDEDERRQLQEELQLKRELAAKKLQGLRDKAAIEANEIWKKCESIKSSERHLKYCCIKKIDPIGVRFGDNPRGYPSIIIPLRNIQGDIRSLQFISVGNDGSIYKTFLTDGEKGGNFFHFGALVDGDPISVTEGYATGCSTFEGYSKKQAVVVAFDCYNFRQVIENLKKTYPKSLITICGDDDKKTSNNPGRSKAEEIGRAAGCNVIFPKFPEDFKLPEGKHPTDFNDLLTHFGLNEVISQLQSPVNLKAVSKADDARKFKFISADSLTQHPPKANWLIKPYLDSGSLAVLFGEPASMKSFLAIDMGFCVATGKDWHGMATRKSGAVFYIAGEGFNGLCKRLRAWSIANDGFLQKTPFFVSNCPAQFLDVSGAAEVVAAIDELIIKYGKPEFVIVDTLNRNFGPGDENQTQDMSKFVACIDTSIRLKYECTVLIVHHSPLNDNKRTRGSSALHGAVDWEYCLTKQGENRKLSPTKVEDYEPPNDILFKPQSILLDGWIDEEDGQVMTSCVLEKISDHPMIEKSNLSKLKGSQKVAFDCLTKLLQVNDKTKQEGIVIDVWREAAYKASISPAGNPEANKKAFQRALIELRDKNYIEVCDNRWKPCGTWDKDGTFKGHVPTN
jgi:phage/plasmid primase-like uncharacterized protein